MQKYIIFSTFFYCCSRVVVSTSPHHRPHLPHLPALILPAFGFVHVSFTWNCHAFLPVDLMARDKKELFQGRIVLLGYTFFGISIYFIKVNFFTQEIKQQVIVFCSVSVDSPIRLHYQFKAYCPALRVIWVRRISSNPIWK